MLTPLCLGFPPLPPAAAPKAKTAEQACGRWHMASYGIGVGGGGVNWGGEGRGGSQKGRRREMELSLPGHVFPLGPVCFLQPQFGEDTHQNHDSNHPTDDVDDEVGLVAGGVMGRVHGPVGHLAPVEPGRLDIVGADLLVQPSLLILAAETEAARATAKRVAADAAIESFVPLAHHIKVAPACLRAGGRLRGVGGWRLTRSAVVPAGIEQHHDAAQVLPDFLLRPTQQKGEKVCCQVAQNQTEEALHPSQQRATRTPEVAFPAAAAAAAAIQGSRRSGAAPRIVHKGGLSWAGTVGALFRSSFPHRSLVAKAGFQHHGQLRGFSTADSSAQAFQGRLCRACGVGGRGTPSSSSSSPPSRQTPPPSSSLPTFSQLPKLGRGSVKRRHL